MKTANKSEQGIKSLIGIIKTYADFSEGVYYPASQQVHKLPELLASGHHVGISFYLEVDGLHFFVEENPGSINGSVFYVYFDDVVPTMDTTRKVRSIIKNNQDAIGINFQNVNFTVN